MTTYTLSFWYIYDGKKAKTMVVKNVIDFNFDKFGLIIKSLDEKEPRYYKFEEIKNFTVIR